MSANEWKLPTPYVVFKRKRMLNNLFPNGIVVQKGWMNNNLVLDWTRTVWQNHLGTLLVKWSLLVLESFCSHVTDKVKVHLHNVSTDMLKLLGASTHWPFTAELRRHYTDCMSSSNWMAQRALLPTVLAGSCPHGAWHQQTLYPEVLKKPGS